MMILQSQLTDKVEQLRLGKESKTDVVLANEELDVLKVLQQLLPIQNDSRQKMTSLEILQSAIDYIADLTNIYEETDTEEFC